MARKATALDVARLARASRSAVSMVFNGRADGSVSKEAQERIWEAARQLEYSPNQIARSLRDQRSHVIGLVSNAAVTSAFDGAIIAGANALAERFGFLTLSTDTENDEHRTVGAVRTLLDRTVD
ncbi:MAG: LacI family DNA-binding transcriptional regulator, partial [Propionibacteriaceae bacterium]|nr:LacI family DNA-binding transcriptional regulator [Propionibacteriaceae bacterium]